MPTRQERAMQYWKADRAFHKVKKQVKRNEQADTVRQNDLSRQLPAALDEEVWTDQADALLEPQRVMPRGERERRRANLELALSVAQGHAKAEQAKRTPAQEPQGRQGLVIEVSSGFCRVETDGEPWLCAVRGALAAADTGMTNIVAVGDRVVVSSDGAGGGVVEEVLPRRTVLARPDIYHSHMQQVIVANAEQLLIVASWREPALWFELVDRYLIAAQRGGLVPILCLNKIDLADDLAACLAALQPYRELGYPLVLASAHSGAGVDDLRRLLRGRLTVLAGLSGVGKSSLLAAIQPGLHLRTSAVSERRHEGRHTTTQVSLQRLEMGAFVIDTPGIRELGLAGLRRSELAGFFPEMAALARRCRFPDCLHLLEPDCAVRQGAREGLVAPTRYDSYVKICTDLLP